VDTILKIYFFISCPKAISSSAFHSASRYFITGLALLEHDSWDMHYNLTIGLHDAASEALYVTGDFSRLAALAEKPLKFARSFEDKLNIYNNLVRSFLASGQLDQGIATCMRVLSQLGEVLPTQITPDIFHIEVVRVKTILDGMSNDQLLSLPIMTDAHKLVNISTCLLCHYSLTVYLTSLDSLMNAGYYAVFKSSSLPSIRVQTCNGSHHCI
jgi:predicted ATPase